MNHHALADSALLSYNELGKQATLLRAKIRELNAELADITELQNTLLPVGRLSDDAILHIFAFLIRPVAEDGQNKDAQVVSQVSRRWRSLAISFPALWSPLMLWWCPEYLRMMLDRSRGAPISLETNRELESTTVLCALLAPHAMRVRSIALRYPEDHHAVDVLPVLRLVAFSPILENLHLRNVHEQGCKWEHDIPGPPISLEIVDSWPDVITGLVNPFLYRIVRLTLSVPEDVTRYSSFPRRLGEILGRMSMLEILTLSHMSDCSGTDQFTVHLPRLTLFRMEDVYASQVGVFVEHLVIPPTTTFRITERSHTLPRLVPRIYEGVRHITLASVKERSAPAEKAKPKERRWILRAYTGDPAATPPPVLRVEIVVPFSKPRACLSNLYYVTMVAPQVETVELVDLRKSYREDVWHSFCSGLKRGAIESLRLTRCAPGAVGALLVAIAAKEEVCKNLRRIEVHSARFSDPERDMRDMLEAREALRASRADMEVEMEWGVTGEEESTHRLARGG